MRRVAGIPISNSRAPITSNAAIRSNARYRLPVLVLIAPTAAWLSTPLRWPALLMMAMPEAAPDALSSAGGMVQNSGTADSAAAAPRLMSTTESQTWPWTTSSRRKQAALNNRVLPRCQRRSMWRSELRPSRYMPHRAPRNGRLETRPMVFNCSRPKPRISVGIQ
ncbi:hypothetical protein D3C79_802720 [compost metagenome]